MVSANVYDAAVLSPEWDLLDWESSLADQFGSAARGQQSDVLLDQAFGEIEEAGFVVDRQNG